MAPQRTLSIGGACFDVFVELTSEALQAIDTGTTLALPLGGKIRASSVQGCPGGGAVNSSVSLQRLGAKASICCMIGSDTWGESLQSALIQEGVDTSATTIIDNEVSSFSLILHGKKRDRCIINNPGVSSHLHDVTFDRSAVAACDLVYLTSMQEASCVIHDDLIEQLSQPGGPKLSWNPGGCQIDMGIRNELQRSLLQYTHVVILNAEEATAFTGDTTWESAMHSCAKLGVQYVCVTDGANGCYGLFNGELVFSPPLSVPIIDTTGAGDAFGSTFSWAILQGWSLPESLKAGTVNAASVLQFIGAQRGLLEHHALLQALNPTPSTLTPSLLS